MEGQTVPFLLQSRRPDRLRLCEPELFAIGPIYEMYSFNQIEGHRIKIGGRTGDSLSQRFFGEAHLIYGTEDKRFQWDVKLNFHINKEKPVEDDRYPCKAGY